ncbi:hypothetical protein Salat_0375000 [Sesamum alatum]|uniref:Uncharacterized protein n=1 Tax=Sesamum alatum TaxID=300844 RepID=A0AAE1Z2X2_9LAMI|nr:hypothetical protein Salat_0375000 [Sesamum alatum]
MDCPPSLGPLHLCRELQQFYTGPLSRHWVVLFALGRYIARRLGRYIARRAGPLSCGALGCIRPRPPAIQSAARSAAGMILGLPPQWAEHLAPPRNHNLAPQPDFTWATLHRGPLRFSKWADDFCGPNIFQKCHLGSQNP